MSCKYSNVSVLQSHHHMKKAKLCAFSLRPPCMRMHIKEMIVKKLISHYSGSFLRPRKNYDELLKRFECEKMPKHKDIKPLIVIARGKELKKKACSNSQLDQKLKKLLF